MSNKYGFTLLNYNFKGGCGKTSLTALESYVLQREGKKVLLIDLDGQQNLSELVKKTYKIDFNATNTITEGLNNFDLSDSVVHANENLDIVPNDTKTDIWFRHSELSDGKRYRVLKDSLSSIKYNYDYIFVDVPPSINDAAINAIIAADGVSVVLQTEQMSYTSALKTVQYLANFRRDYDTNFDLLGIIIYMYRNAAVNREIKNRAQKVFSGGLFKNEITGQERVNTFAYRGITYEGRWDKRAVDMYKALTDELETKVKDVIQNEK